MSILIKKFVNQGCSTPKLTLIHSDTECIAEFTEEWGVEFDGGAVQDVLYLAVNMFRINEEAMDGIELSSVEWATNDGITKCRLSVDVMMKNKSGTAIIPCVMESTWQSYEYLCRVLDDAAQRLDALRLACADYAAGLQRA